MFGTLLAQMGQDGAAMVMLHHSLGQNPENPECLYNLANCMRRQGHRKSAAVIYEQALLLDQNNPEIYSGLSGCFINNGTPEKAIEWADKGLKLNPENASALHHKAIALLEQGEFEEGFKAYEARKRIPEWTKRVYEFPQWNGEKVKTLLIHGEQGIGDEILYLSWLPKIAHLYERLVIECTPRLVPTFERSFGAKCYGTDKEVVANEKDISAVVAMGSLPAIAGGLPPKGRYLIPNQERVNHYRQRLHALGKGPYIGLSWHGGVVKTHAHFRTTDSSEWARFKSYGTPISIQYGSYGADSQKLGLPHWQEAIDDIDELVSLLAALDLVVTVNNTNVHMCGALDVPCWTLTPSRPAWRYQLSGSEIPWYRSIRQFRQQGDDWSGVFAEVESALGDYCREKVAA
jgi:tetratricopeptide (TPR) repeat protein